MRTVIPDEPAFVGRKLFIVRPTRNGHICPCGFAAIGDLPWLAEQLKRHAKFCPGPQPQREAQHGTSTAAPNRGAPGNPSPAGPAPSPPGPAGDPPT